MRTINLTKNKISLFDNIEDLPIVRFQKFNKYSLIDAGVGSDLSDFDAKIERVLRFMKKGAADKAVTELDNLRQNVYLIQSEINAKHLAFATLVHSINDTPRNDLSQEGLAETLKLIADITHAEITNVSDDVKKKINDELTAYFPKIFETSDVKEYYDILRDKVLAQLRGITERVDNSNEIDALVTELLTFSDPSKFSGSDSAEILYDKQFESMCVTLSQQLHIKPKELSVLEFYSAYETLTAQNKPAKNK